MVAYYLCGRRNKGNYTTLGRETALDPVTWTDDGWFLINEGKGPSENQDGPELPVHEKNKSIFLDELIIAVSVLNGNLYATRIIITSH